MRIIGAFVKAAGCVIEAQGHIGIGETDVRLLEVGLSLRIVATSYAGRKQFSGERRQIRTGKSATLPALTAFGTRPMRSLVAAAWAQSPRVAGRSLSNSRPPADLAQLMKGIIYPSSNVFFAAQADDPAKIKPDSKPSASPNLLTSTFGRWEAENSAIALAESATLLRIPGRKCSNGVDVPLKNPDWEEFVTELRGAGVLAHKAAKSKNQESVLSAAEALTAACSGLSLKVP